MSCPLELKAVIVLALLPLTLIIDGLWPDCSTSKLLILADFEKRYAFVLLIFRPMVMEFSGREPVPDLIVVKKSRA